ncbi:mobilization protein, partial [Kitasatospora sp. NPDC001225]
MIVHLQRAATTAALIPTPYGLDDLRGQLRPRLIGADYRGADKQLPLFGDPQEVLGGGVLDAPALRIGSRAPELPVWMCSVRSDPLQPDLSDAQWADVSRRLVTATGLAPTGDPNGCRWAAIRNDDRSVHVVATVVREDGYIHSTY